MASISGIQGGLGLLQPVPTMVRKEAKPKPYVPPDLDGIEGNCRACSRFVHAYKRGRSYHGLRDGMCQHCGAFFGSSFMNGCTNADPETALQRINGVRDEGFAMVLRDLTLGAPDGRAVSISVGDIFAVSVKNPEPTDTGEPSKENTWALFMLTLDVGPYQARLFPHEFASISLQKVMEMKREGSIIEHFTSADDKNGHFTPSPEMRELIMANFGRLVR